MPIYTLHIDGLTSTGLPIELEHISSSELDLITDYLKGWLQQSMPHTIIDWSIISEERETTLKPPLT